MFGELDLVVWRLSSALGQEWIRGLVGQTETALVRYDVENH